MRKVLLALLPLALLLCATQTVRSQEQRQSPHEKATVTLGGATITVDYGRPYMKGRRIFGGLEPYGKVWRTGADEATTFTTDKDLMLGALHVPAGTYALFTIPGEKEWTISLNKVAKTFGAFDYEKNKAQDLGQLKAPVEKLSMPVEQLTISVLSKGGKNGALRIVWADTSVSAPIMVH